MDAYNTQFSELLIRLSGKINKDLFRTERILSDMLHVLRDNLPYEKAVLFYKVLPEYMRNFYTSGWNNSDIEKPADHFSELESQFLKCEEDITEEAFDHKNEMKGFLVTILELLRDLIPGNQLKKVIHGLPEDIRESIMNDVYPGNPTKV